MCPSPGYLCRIVRGHSRRPRKNLLSFREQRLRGAPHDLTGAAPRDTVWAWTSVGMRIVLALEGPNADSASATSRANRQTHQCLPFAFNRRWPGRVAAGDGTPA